MFFLFLTNALIVDKPLEIAPAPREITVQMMPFTGASLAKLRAKNVDLKFSDKEMTKILDNGPYETVILEFKKDAATGVIYSMRAAVTTNIPKAKDVLLIDGDHRDYASMVEMYQRFYR